MTGEEDVRRERKRERERAEKRNEREREKEAARYVQVGFVCLSVCVCMQEVCVACLCVSSKVCVWSKVSVRACSKCVSVCVCECVQRCGRSKVKGVCERRDEKTRVTTKRESERGSFTR